MIDIKTAVQTLTNALLDDGDFMYGYQSNIAMAFQDEFKRILETGDVDFAVNHIHEIANNAAINFLNNWCSDATENESTTTKDDERRYFLVSFHLIDNSSKDRFGMITMHSTEKNKFLTSVGVEDVIRRSCDVDTDQGIINIQSILEISKSDADDWNELKKKKKSIPSDIKFRNLDEKRKNIIRHSVTYGYIIKDCRDVKLESSLVGSYLKVHRVEWVDTNRVIFIPTKKAIKDARNSKNEKLQYLSGIGGDNIVNMMRDSLIPDDNVFFAVRGTDDYVMASNLINSNIMEVVGEGGDNELYCCMTSHGAKYLNEYFSSIDS